MAFSCSPCNRDFKNENGLNLHLQYSKVHQDPAVARHASRYTCLRCGPLHEYETQEDLRMHIIASDEHFACVKCLDGGALHDFWSEGALQNHIAAKHWEPEVGTNDEVKNGDRTTEQEEMVRETPLDAFFASFAGFAYDPLRSPEASWKALRRFKRWNNAPGGRAPAENDAWTRYQGALVEEVELWYGDENDLTAWRTLCKAVGCVDPPYEIGACKKIIKTTHVNIVDLINWMRRDEDDEDDEDEGGRVTVFKSVGELARYTLKNKKVFPKKQVKKYTGKNVVLKYLLRVIL